MSPVDPAPEARATPCIGVFDSGVGGLSVLPAIRRALPSVPLHYLADSAYAPYGERHDGEILERSQRLTAHLRARGTRVIVVACNTATAVAIDALRQVHADTRFVGVEPGVRPALALSPRRRIAVMATEATLRSARFEALLAREAGHAWVHRQACRGLAAAIERHAPDDPALIALTEHHAREVREADVDAVALGCTHYPFVRDTIARVLGDGVAIIDTATAVAAQTVRLWSTLQGVADMGTGCTIETTGDAGEMTAFVSRWSSIGAVGRATALTL